MATKLDFSQYTTVVGYDCSGSTDISFSQSSFYHTQTQNIVKDLNSETTLFIRWDDNHKIISKVDLEIINKNKKGFGGTSPITFFNFIKSIGFKGDLIFISDGQIGDYCALTCSEILMDCKFDKVWIYLIYTGGTINESVSCALTRNSPHEINIYKNLHNNTPTESISVSNEDFNFVFNIDSINSIEEFLRQKETIKNVLFSVNTGTAGNKVLHKKLVDLKNKLTKIESKSFMKSSDNPVSHLIESFKCQELSSSYLNDVWKMYYGLNEDNVDVDDENDWQKIIDKFISWCSGSLSRVFDRNKASNREQTSRVTPIIPSESVQVLEEKIDDVKMTCPISLSDTSTSNIIILMRRKNSTVLSDMPTNLRDSLINCPLNALRNKNIMLHIKSLFDSVISIEAYKDLVEHGISDESPLTREEIFGGLCLGKDKSHVQATNSTIRHILTGGKSLGNVDLWFAVIYLIVKRGYAEHLNEYLPAFEEHLQFRLLNSKSYMCLSGLPTYPTYSVPLGLALWSSVMATSCSVSSVVKDPKLDPIRLHLSYSYDIIEILNTISIEVPMKLMEHIDRLKVLRHFLLEFKKGKDETAKLKNIVDALFYNAIETQDLWVLIDGQPTDEQISKVKNQLPIVCRNFSNQDIKYILDLCDSNKAEADIYIDYNYTSKPDVKNNLKNWNFENNIPFHTVNICPKTCRPFYNIIDNGFRKTWLDKAIEVYGYTLFSTNNFFGKYVLENQKYPTKSEFLNYIFMYHFTRDKITLPICIQQFVDEVFEDYKDILTTISPSDFAKRWEDSTDKDWRQRMEL